MDPKGAAGITPIRARQEFMQVFKGRYVAMEFECEQKLIKRATYAIRV